MGDGWVTMVVAVCGCGYMVQMGQMGVVLVLWGAGLGVARCTKLGVFAHLIDSSGLIAFQRSAGGVWKYV